MLKPIINEAANLEKELENERCISDLIRNANSHDYTNEKGFKQKYIDLLFKRGYYKSNESIFLKKRS